MKDVTPLAKTLGRIVAALIWVTIILAMVAILAMMIALVVKFMFWLF